MAGSRWRPAMPGLAIVRRNRAKALFFLLICRAAAACGAPLPAAPARPHTVSFFGALAGDAHAAADLFYRQLAQPVRGQGGLLTCLALAVTGLVLAWPLRLWLIYLAKRLLARWDPDGRCHPQARAVVIIVVTTFLVGAGVHLLRVALRAGFVQLPETAALIDTAAAGLAVVGLGIGIGHALWPADHPDRRPLPFPESLGRSMGFYPVAGAALLGLSGVVERAAVLLHVSSVGWMLAHGLVILLEAGLTIAFLVAVGKTRDAHVGAPGSPSFTLTALAWAAVALGLLGFLFGYTLFAALLFQELIWASMVAVTALLLVRLFDALFAWLFGSEHAASRFATHIIGLRRARIDQVRILAVGIATFAIWMLAIGMMLAPLGGAGASLVDQVQPRLIGDELRNLHIAPKAIASAVLILLVGIALTRILRRWLQRRFLPATALDIGVRTSIVTGLSYAGILLALLMATRALGIALDKITLIASALSVGIGFGLQSIIQNFVSGVILLIERPIKVGDWVVASGAEGSVRRIKVRATEIAMPDGSITIVPNSSFISANVQNRTAAGIQGRIDLTIKLTGVSAPGEVRDAILKSIEGLDRIRKDPPPKLLLTDASQDTCGFQLQAYAETRHPTAEAKSELLYALADRLHAAGLKAALS